MFPTGAGAQIVWSDGTTSPSPGVTQPAGTAPVPPPGQPAVVQPGVDTQATMTPEQAGQYGLGPQVGPSPSAQSMAADCPPGCPPELCAQIKLASEAADRARAERIRRDISQPQPIRELTCLDNIFNRSAGFGLRIPGIDDILASVRNRVCQAVIQMASQATAPISQQVQLPGMRLPGDIYIPGGGISTGQSYGNGYSNWANQGNIMNRGLNGSFGLPSPASSGSGSSWLPSWLSR